MENREIGEIGEIGEMGESPFQSPTAESWYQVASMEDLSARLLLQELSAGYRPCLIETCERGELCSRPFAEGREETANNANSANLCLCPLHEEAGPFCMYCLSYVSPSEEHLCWRVEEERDGEEKEGEEGEERGEKQRLRSACEKLNQKFRRGLFRVLRNRGWDENLIKGIFYELHDYLGDIFASKFDPSGETWRPKREQERPIKFLVLGKTGVGKSLTCSFLTETRNIYLSSSSLLSETSRLQSLSYMHQFSPQFLTETHQNLQTSKHGAPFHCIDCPGFFDTRGVDIDQILLSLSQSTPCGVDAILLVLDGRRLTEEELAPIRAVERVFGPSVWDHTLLVFSHSADDTICSRIVELDEQHMLYSLVRSMSWRIWKTENHKWLFSHYFPPERGERGERRGEEREEREEKEESGEREERWEQFFSSDGKVDKDWEIIDKEKDEVEKEFAGLKNSPAQWVQQSQFDRDVIHSFLVQMVKRNKGRRIGYRQQEALLAAREKVCTEHSRLMGEWEKERLELRRKYYQGFIGKDELERGMKSLEGEIKKFRRDSAEIELQHQKKFLETKFNFLSFAGKGLVAAAGFAAVSYITTMATAAIVSMGPGLALASGSALVWRVFGRGGGGRWLVSNIGRGDRRNDDKEDREEYDSKAMLRTFLMTTLNASVRSFVSQKISSATRQGFNCIKDGFANQVQRAYGRKDKGGKDQEVTIGRNEALEDSTKDEIRTDKGEEDPSTASTYF